MTYYDKKNFEYCFAKRTKSNLQFIDNYVNQKTKQGIPEEEYQVYEVTQLINSFLGLIVIPKEASFKYLDDATMFVENSDAFNILKQLSTDKNRYINTYYLYKNRCYQNEYEQLTPKNLLLRLRNAISHGNFKIIPEKPDIYGQIEKFTFSDHKVIVGNFDENGIFIPQKDGIKYEMAFLITLTIAEIRILLFALNDLLISKYEE